MPIEVFNRQGVLVHHDAGLVYWPILKNGHTAIQNHLQQNGFMAERRDRGYIGMQDFAVLREPVRRYVSGIAQMWRSGHKVPRKRVGLWRADWAEYVDGINTFNRTGDEVWTCDGDMHLSRQVDRLAAASDPVLFHLEHPARLWAWISERIGPTVGLLSVVNPTDPPLIGQALELLDPAPILAWYAADVDLYSRSHAVT